MFFSVQTLPVDNREHKKENGITNIIHNLLTSNTCFKCFKRFSTQNTDEKEKKLILFQSVIEPV